MTLIIVRHCQSEWNKLNKFTGLQDIDLSENGKTKALECGKLLMDYQIDIAYTSELKRTYHTCELIKKGSTQNFEIIKNGYINERDYGNLTGLNKDETKKIYGEEQVQLWRRSVDIRPPGGENLLEVIDRVRVFYENIIKKHLNNNDNILIVGHGNSIRSLMVVIGLVDIKNIPKFETIVGIPMVIDLENKNYFNLWT